MTTAQKAPYVQTVNAFAQQKVLGAIIQLGKSLPCHVVKRAGQFVTVAFDIQNPPFTIPQVTIPIITSRYDWLPIEVGARGFTGTADVSLAGASGQPGGTASLVQPANLTPLVFTPVANASWTVPDTDQRVVQGPSGVLLRDLGGASSINLTPTGITLTSGGHTIAINSGGVIIDGKVFLTHEHINGGGVGNSGTVA